MYYVSKKIGMRKFAVMNTDDGLEEELTWDEIETATCKLGIHIEGVSTRGWHGGAANPLVVSNIEVALPVSAKSLKSVKLKALSGVDIGVSDGCIVSVDWLVPDDSKMRVVRFSDYGTSCGANVFSKKVVEWYMQKQPSYLTVVLDDKIDVHPKTFKGISSTDIVFDLREVTKPTIVEAVYLEVIQRLTYTADIRRKVLDKPERMDFWIGVRIANAGLIGSTNEQKLTDCVHDAGAVTKQVYARYRKDFIKVCNKYVPKIENHQYRNNSIGIYVNRLLGVKRPMLSCNDFDIIWEEYADRKQECCMLIILQNHTSGGEPKALVRLRHFIQYFGVNKEIKENFVTFYKRMNDILIQMCRERGIIS